MLSCLTLVFAEYQFLRYFIPGSLYVIYTSLLIIPNLGDDVVKYLGQNGNVLIGVFGGAFAAGLAFGYVIYTFYDTWLYNRLAMRPCWRDILKYMDKINVWKELNNEQKKEFLDTLYYYLGDRDPMNQKFSETIRGIWSHFNARIVCSIFVPAFSIATIFLLRTVELGSDIKFELFYFRSFHYPGFQIKYFCFSLAIIIAISIVLVIGARRPYKEAVKLEFYFLKLKIEKSRTEFESLARILLSASFPNKKCIDASKTRKRNIWSIGFPIIVVIIGVVIWIFLCNTIM